MHRRPISFCLSVLAVVLLSSDVRSQDSAAATDAKSIWITSIDQLNSSGRFVAATANGLLLREASVFSFDAANPTQLTLLYTHPAAVWRVDAASDGSKVASVDYRGNLVVFDTASSESTTHEKAFERWCQAMMMSPDNQSVVAGNEAGKVMIWDLQAGKVSKSVELDEHAVTGLAISPDGSQLAASDGAGHVHLLKWPSLESIGKIEVSKETAWCVAFVDDGKNLLVGSSDRHLYRCEAKADAKAESVAKGTDWITQLAVSPAGQVAAAEVGGALHFPSTGGTDSMNAPSGVWSLCWNGDAQLFAGTRKDGNVSAGRSWKWTEVKPPAKPEAEQPKAEEAQADKEMKEEAKEQKPEPEKDAEPQKKEEPAKEKPAEEKADEKKADDKKAEEKKAEEKPEANDKPADQPKADEPGENQKDE